MTTVGGRVQPIYSARAAAGTDRTDGAIASVTAWIDSEPMRDLVEVFDEPWPRGSLQRVLQGLETISTQHWDYRGRDNKERWESEEPTLPEYLVDIVYGAGRRMGLVDGSTPLATDYDAVAVVGGGRKSPLLRAGYLSELMKTGAVSTDRIFLLGGTRQLIPSEYPYTETYAPGATVEFDLVNAAARIVFGVDTYDEEASADANSNAHWRVWRYHEIDGVRVTSFSAPTSDLARRPNTADAFNWLMRCSNLRRGQRLLLVTAAWYTAYQGFDAMRVIELPDGPDTEIVGFGVERAPDQLSAPGLLQEIHSGIRSARQVVFKARKDSP